MPTANFAVLGTSAVCAKLERYELKTVQSASEKNSAPALPAPQRLTTGRSERNPSAIRHTRDPGVRTTRT